MIIFDLQKLYVDLMACLVSTEMRGNNTEKMGK